MATTLPALPLESWSPTKDTLHLYAQIVGKVRLAATPRRNHWWNVTLYVSTRGLATGPMHLDGIDFDLELDFIDHALVGRTSAGAVERVELRDGLSVSAFFTGTLALLDGFGVHPRLEAKPFGVPMTTPFADDVEHASYDAEAVGRFWDALRWNNRVFNEFAGWFCGKASPVHLFWHSFDLAMGRFSGRPAPARPGADRVTAEAYSHEIISFGFWAGDTVNPFPAYYSYTSPEPVTLASHPLRPQAAEWQQGAGGSHLALLRYDDVRASDDPRATLLGFLESAYEAGATSAGWDVGALSTQWCPVVT